MGLVILVNKLSNKMYQVNDPLNKSWMILNKTSGRFNVNVNFKHMDCNTLLTIQTNVPALHTISNSVYGTYESKVLLNSCNVHQYVIRVPVLNKSFRTIFSIRKSFKILDCLTSTLRKNHKSLFYAAFYLFSVH